MPCKVSTPVNSALLCMLRKKDSEIFFGVRLSCMKVYRIYQNVLRKILHIYHSAGDYNIIGIKYVDFGSYRNGKIFNILDYSRIVAVFAKNIFISVSGKSSAVIFSRYLPEQITSLHPTFPHVHFSSIFGNGMCPSSPAAPLRPQ